MDPEILEALIRKLADVHSQRNIATILNERDLFRRGGFKWDQGFVSRYMKANGIHPKYIWKGAK